MAACFRIGFDLSSNTAWQPEYSDHIVYQKNHETQMLCLHSLNSDFMWRIENIYSKCWSRAWNLDANQIFWTSTRSWGILWNNHRRGWRVVFISGSELSHMPCAVFCSVFLFGQFGMGWVWKHCIVKDMCVRVTRAELNWAELTTDGYSLYKRIVVYLHYVTKISVHRY